MDIIFIGLILAALVLYLFWRNFTRMNNRTLVKFSIWRTHYDSARNLEKISMAKALFLQSMNLATVVGADIPNAEEFQKKLNREDPSDIMEECLEHGLPMISDLLGQDAVMELPARDVGMFFIIGMANRNSQLAMQSFLAKYSKGVGSITCEDCGYTEDLVDFSENNDPNAAIYQCEACGRFIEERNFLTERVHGACPCGGAINPQAALFCPKCKSKNVKYEIKYPEQESAD